MKPPTKKKSPVIQAVCERLRDERVRHPFRDILKPCEDKKGGKRNELAKNQHLKGEPYSSHSGVRRSNIIAWSIAGRVHKSPTQV